jgi:23S rRNA (pseudouridine1915-N3)-methyltransferase
MLRLSLLTASNRQPEWVDAGADDYAKRLRGRCTLEIKTVPLARRTATTSVERAVADEGERLLALLPNAAHVVALCEGGKPWSTKELAAKLEGWMQLGAPVAFLVGGPDGLSQSCIDRAHERWSLSNLTLPHGLVKVVVAEALYRAWSVLEHHPYRAPAQNGLGCMPARTRFAPAPASQASRLPTLDRGLAAACSGPEAVLG